MCALDFSIMGYLWGWDLARLSLTKIRHKSSGLLENHSFFRTCRVWGLGPTCHDTKRDFNPQSLPRWAWWLRGPRHDFVSLRNLKPPFCSKYGVQKLNFDRSFSWKPDSFTQNRSNWTNRPKVQFLGCWIPTLAWMREPALAPGNTSMIQSKVAVINQCTLKKDDFIDRVPHSHGWPPL